MGYRFIDLIYSCPEISPLRERACGYTDRQSARWGDHWGIPVSFAQVKFTAQTSWISERAVALSTMYMSKYSEHYKI